MPMPYFLKNYYKPKSIKQAIGLLSELGNTAKVIAGGTDILPRRQGGVIFNTTHHLIDISGLELNYIRKTTGRICIGTATDINSISTSPLFHSSPYNVLAEAATVHSTYTIRNRATIGGNLCNASPCADLALPLLALSASVVVAGPKGRRSIQLNSFFKGPNCTVLDSDEILQEIVIPIQQEISRASFLKLRHHQTAVDMAVVNVATHLCLKGNKCLSAIIALGSVGPTSFLAKKAAALLSGQTLDKKLIQQAAKMSASESAPINDNRATASYRKEMVAVLVENSLEKNLQRSPE
jgi:aerobic carbon-monoxide dehydrogenase medium subunit